LALAATNPRKSLSTQVANSSTPQTAVLTASPCSKSTVAACCAWRRMCEPAAKNLGTSPSIPPATICSLRTNSPTKSSRFASTKRPARSRRQRSEEHTSELQSRGHLVCRLLLEKKKKFRSQKYGYPTSRILSLPDGSFVSST